MKKKIRLMDIQIASFVTKAEKVTGGNITEPSVITLCENCTEFPGLTGD
ncbi:MAG: hypothetical protein WBB45_00170 [Cyclobacteriaceae bacterium]